MPDPALYLPAQRSHWVYQQSKVPISASLLQEAPLLSVKLQVMVIEFSRRVPQRTMRSS